MIKRSLSWYFESNIFSNWSLDLFTLYISNVRQKGLLLNSYMYIAYQFKSFGNNFEVTWKSLRNKSHLEDLVPKMKSWLCIWNHMEPIRKCVPMLWMVIWKFQVKITTWWFGNSKSSFPNGDLEIPIVSQVWKFNALFTLTPVLVFNHIARSVKMFLCSLHSW